MSATHDFLIEIGTEELPAQGLRELAEAFEKNIVEQVEKAGLKLAATETKFYATPRRLAVVVNNLANKQKNHFIERKGPVLSAAFDAEGKPTPASLGFARSCGVSIEQLQTEKTAKGDWLVYRAEQAGEAAKKLLPPIVQQAINQLPLPRSMRWGTERTPFLRPVRWVVMLLDDTLIEAEFFGLTTTHQTRGHRFHHPGPITIPHAKDYAEVLKTQGKVIADFDERRKNIEAQLIKLAKEKNCRVHEIEGKLLEEVTGLVEWPVALLGNFSKDFLELPQEVLTTVMAHHQKCFALINDKELLPHFITVANIESKNPQQVIAGNERVINARLADAEFFYEQDFVQHTPVEHERKLKNVVFMQNLGSMYDKSFRIERLSERIFKDLQDHIQHHPEWKNFTADDAAYAGRWAKMDLVFALVDEFPELQGIIGRYYYAQNNKEREAVAPAIEEHYQPHSATDQLPQSPLGQVVGIADRLDTLLGLFGIGLTPTGDKDPFGLRRAALAIVRILIEKELPLDLKVALAHAREEYRNPVSRLKGPASSTNSSSAEQENYQGANINVQAKEQVLAFIFERLRAWYAEQQITTDVFDAVLACHPTKPWDFHQRIQAVQHFKQLPQAAALAAANKRVSNILKKEKAIAVDAKANPELLIDDAECKLEEALRRNSEAVKELCQKIDYIGALTKLASLQQPIDNFFNEVLVMAPDEKLRQNRLALLNQLRQLFLQVADISLLQINP